jgi:CspA family cold shock protein
VPAQTGFLEDEGHNLPPAAAHGVLRQANGQAFWWYGPLGRKDGKHRMSQTGTVKFFNTDKGFGFIKPDNGGPDIFVHISAVQASGLNGLTENQKVSYDTEPDKRGKGPKAVNLRAD